MQLKTEFEFQEENEKGTEKFGESAMAVRN